ncbi:endonuclease/exonuclease/phosphatase family protein [Brucellaceae bacterium C25G]
MPSDKKPTTLTLAAFFIAILATTPLVLGFFGQAHPALDAFSHLRAHLSAALFLFSFMLVFTSLRREALMLCVFCLLCFGTTLDTVRNQISGVEQQSVVNVEGANYSLVQINLLYNHPEPQQVLQMIGRQNPDIVTYQEASQYWEPWLKILEGRYPYHLMCKDQPNSWGVGILSRRPFTEGAETLCVGDGVLASVQVDLGGEAVRIASLHLSWPWPKTQPEQLNMLEPYLRGMKHPLIIAGDYNAVSWSNTVKRVESASQTNDIGNIGATFMLKQLPMSWVGWLGVQIDHLLVSSDIRVSEAKTIDDAGSDHLPLLLRFNLPIKVPHDKTDDDKAQASLR